jgi:hypothetical protein
MKTLCKEKGLPATGKTEELRVRLIEHLEPEIEELKEIKMDPECVIFCNSQFVTI